MSWVQMKLTHFSSFRQKKVDFEKKAFGILPSSTRKLILGLDLQKVIFREEHILAAT